MQNNTHPFLKRCFEFVWYRALAELRSDASRGFLGFFWWVIEPLFYMGIFYVVFGLVFSQKDQHYVSFLLCGLVFWKWFDSSIRNSSVSIQHSMGLVYQVYLPKIVFPLVTLTNSCMKFIIVFFLFICFLFAQGIMPNINWVIDLPLLLILQLSLMLGIGMTLSAVVPFIPDIRFLVDNGMTLLFFLSGIFFRFEKIPETLAPYFKFNPIGMLITEYRHVLIQGENANWLNLVPAIMITIFFVIAGVYLLNKNDRQYAKRAFL